MVIRIGSPSPTSVTNFFVTQVPPEKCPRLNLSDRGWHFGLFPLVTHDWPCLQRALVKHRVGGRICRDTNDCVSYAASHLLNRQPGICWAPPARLQPVSFSRFGAYRLAPREKTQRKNGSAKHGKNQPHESVIALGVRRINRVQRIKKPDAMLGGEQRRRASDRPAQQFTAVIHTCQQAKRRFSRIFEINLPRHLQSVCLTKQSACLTKWYLWFEVRFLMSI